MSVANDLLWDLSCAIRIEFGGMDVRKFGDEIIVKRNASSQLCVVIKIARGGLLVTKEDRRFIVTKVWANDPCVPFGTDDFMPRLTAAIQTVLDEIDVYWRRIECHNQFTSPLR
jgi:hypothetical protein